MSASAKCLTFITGNANKLREFTEILGPVLSAQAVTFTNQDIDLIEV
jgi:inosine/xanthosine triphosphate pyrophosphatase family protein